MTTFTLTGQQGGHEEGVSLTWEDGHLSGDPVLVMMVRTLAVGYEGRPVGNSLYGFTTHNHLSSPYTAYQIMRSLFSGHPTMTGDFPQTPQPPEGAIP